MATTQKRLLTPIKYEIGKDITQEHYNEALLKIADWLSEWRKTREPATVARQLMQCCLNGTKLDGTPWFSAASSSLDVRVRMMCRFDIATMSPLRKGSEKTRKAKDKERLKRLEKLRAAQHDELIPDEIRKDLAKSAKYGDNANVMLSSAEHRMWQDLRDAYVRQFPELGTINAEAELKLLCDLHVLTERYRMKLLSGESLDAGNRRAAAEELQSLKKALGIHPDQLVKRVSSKADFTIGAAAARLEAMPDYRQLRQRFWVEELLQLYQMFHTPTADGTGHQLDEVGLFGLTKCRTCHCAKCGVKNFAGMDITEVEQYLLRKGVIEEVSDAGSAT